METLLVSVLFVYGITTILVDTDGPGGIFYKLRQKLKALECFICTGFYVAMFASLATAANLFDFIVHTFVILGGAVLLYRLGDR